jgi:membrane protease YdiL (CAAX protease family)
MPGDEEIVNLIKSAAKSKEDQFDKMSIEELESLYQQGSALSNNKAFFKDLYLFEGVNKLKGEIKKRKNKRSATINSVDVVAFHDAQWKTKWLIVGLIVIILWRCIAFLNFKWLSHLQLWFYLVLVAVISLGFEAFLLLFPIVTRNPHQRRSFGFPAKTSCLREFGIAIPVVIVTLVFFSGVNALVGRVSPGTSLEPDIIKNMIVSRNHMFIYLLFLFSFTLVPIAEEMFFRGFLHNAFRKRMPWPVAGLIQCLLFGFCHTFGGIHAAVTFVIGLILTAVYQWRKTLITPIFVHAGINFISLLSVVILMNIYTNGPAIGVNGDLNSTPCVIKNIMPNSAAEAADLHVGDIITAINGKPIRNFQQLIENFLLHKPGDEVLLTINRAGRIFEVNVVLQKRGKP